MVGERFQNFAGVKLTHVPYNGNGPAITDLVANRVQLLWTSLAPVRGFVDAGQLKLVGTTSSKRAAATRDVPTFDESGLPGYELNNWYGVLAPAGTPQDIALKLNGALAKTMANEDVQKKLSSMNIMPDQKSRRFWICSVMEPPRRWSPPVLRVRHLRSVALQALSADNVCWASMRTSLVSEATVINLTPCLLRRAVSSTLMAWMPATLPRLRAISRISAMPSSVCCASAPSGV